MAGCTSTGLTEMRRGVRSLPADVTARLRDVAGRTAERVKTRAQAHLRRQTKGTGAQASAIHVVEVPERKAFEVRSGEAPGRHPILGFWLELGTRHMAARPHMGPALDEESDNYRRDMRAASEDAAAGVLG